MSNALRLDYTIHQPPLTHRDAPGEMTPYRLGFLMEAHDRFVLSYLAFSTGEDLQELWVLTSGLCSSSERVTPIRDEIARLQASEAAETVGRAVAHGPQALRMVAPAAGAAVTGAVVRWVGALEEENKR